MNSGEQRDSSAPGDRFALELRAAPVAPDDPELPTAPGRRISTGSSPSTSRVHAPAELGPGALVGGYVIEARRGGGGFASVYRAHDTRTGAAVALKVLHAYLAHTTSVRRRFRREAETIARLTHAQIVRLLDHGEHHGVPYLVMEWVDGETLGEAIKARGPIPLDEAMPIFEALAGALAAAHAQGVIHRDLKVANVALAGSGAKLLDFGIAKLGEVPVPGGFTTPGTKLGTPHYMAPEQILGRTIDRRTDVYAFGILVFEVLTGRRPFEGPNLVEIEERQLAEPAPAASQLAALPAAIDRVIWRAMDKDPARRYPTIEEAIAELRAAGSAPEAAPPIRHAAVALFVHACMGSAEPDDHALDSFDRVVSEIRSGAARLGLEVAAELGRSLLLVGIRRERTASSYLATIEAFAHDVATRAQRADLAFALTLHAGDVEVAYDRTGSRLVGGSLLELAAWTRTDEPGIHITPAALRA